MPKKYNYFYLKRFFHAFHMVILTIRIYEQAVFSILEPLWSVVVC